MNEASRANEAASIANEPSSRANESFSRATDVTSKDMEQTLNKNEAVIKFYWAASYANVAWLKIFDTKKCFVSQIFGTALG